VPAKTLGTGTVANQDLGLFGADDECVCARFLSLCPDRLRTPFCRAREMARQLRSGHSGGRACDPFRVARESGFHVEEDAWEAAGGAIEYVGELDGGARLIRINMRPVRWIETLLAGAPVESPWNRATGIAGAVVAHELYHGLRECGGGRTEEAAAHAFARELLRMPFSPLLYEWLLRENPGPRDLRNRTQRARGHGHSPRA
jgi:hypothetical protein